MRGQFPSLETLIVIAFAVAALSIIVSRAKITSKIRATIAQHVHPLRYLIYCWFCSSCWITAGFVGIYDIQPLFLSWLAIVGINAIICGVVLFFTPMGAEEQKLMLRIYAAEKAAKHEEKDTISVL